MLGWVFHLSLAAVFPVLVAMKANTAACFILAGFSLLLQAGPPQSSVKIRVARALALLVLCVGVLTLVEYIFGWNLRIDELLFRDRLREAEPSWPGRMSPASTVNFALVGAALFVFDLPLLFSRRHWLAHYCALAVVVISLLAFVGYFYGVEVPSRVAPYVTIALHTVLGFWLLSLGILFARPKRGLMALFTSQSLGSILARQMLPAAILVPLFAGWLRVLGERAGFYELGLGASMFTTLVIVLFVTLIASTARTLNRVDTERQKAHEQIRALAARLQTVREEERTSLAREIHDVLAQELTRIKIDLVWLSRRVDQPVDDSKRAAVQQKLTGTLELANTAISLVQKIATDLRPVVLDTLGLTAAIEWQAKEFETRTGILSVAAVPTEDLALERDHSTALFRILQESLTNIARHSGATKVEIDLVCEPDQLVLSVHDNGRGIRPEQLNDPHSLGLIGMRERATLLGGQCSISGSPSEGTTVEVRFPLSVENGGY